MPRKEIKIDLMIHDLKTPLAVVQAGIENLLNRQDAYGQLSARQIRVLNRILRNTRAAQLMVADALELGRSGEGKVFARSMALGEVIHHCLVEFFDLVDTGVSESIRGHHDLAAIRVAVEKVRLNLEFTEEDWCRNLTLDPVKAVQILRNLLSNAFKFRQSRVTVGGGFDGEAFYLRVADDGQGIPSIYHQKIFENYFQVDSRDVPVQRGHGVGLAGVLLLVEDLGGTIHLNSDSGQGTEFTVRLPLLT